MKTTHQVYFENSQNLASVASESVDLVVTSPPYPMIEMWDDLFVKSNPEIEASLEKGDGQFAFERMHQELDLVWNEVYRVLREDRFVCINIGDATRTVKGEFGLYPNHARILNYLVSLGFCAMPDILWRKQTNAPNKFMGSGMLPAGAYVTLEHEYILILRKGSKRKFGTQKEKQNRRESAFFWEERNIWFSDIWTDIKGTKQELSETLSRWRSAAYPFELAYRLIHMYSVKEDVVLDPFWGTGTTTAAAMAAGRNSIGFEIEPSFCEIIPVLEHQMVDFSNDHILRRIEKHLHFVKERVLNQGPLKYENIYYGFPVMTCQEKELIIHELQNIRTVKENILEVCYSNLP